MFGEIALLHGIARLATITTTTPCELLMIKKEDFDSVLKETVLKAWTEIQKIMNELSYFKSWDSMTKIECSTLSRTKSFAPEETILGDDIGSPTFVYFITKGTCCIIENLEVMVINVKGIEKYRLLNGEAVQTDGSEDTVSAIFDKYLTKDLKSEFGLRDWRKDDSSDKLIGSMTQTGGMSAFSSAPSKTMRTETHFINVCELRKGACFNVGENLQRRRVVATTPTHCLLVPRYWIMKNNSDNIWNRVQQFLNKHIPTSEQIFDNFIHERKFKRYRKGLVKDLLAEKKVANTNTIHNVPYSIRLKEGVDVDYS
ncbi:unnamed protein product [Phaedon cochleariae]|uniref:Cyclic nucleotide-binding domain-containing protein n=1 Tax=Phaedon cochleariae TaxID=80249 RepID=A0A9N9SAK4_PHACE|nr:unnamed protein product [Phaedon cochleariae]